MKNKYLVSALLMLLSPAISQAAAVDWTSQKYNLYAYLDIDEPEQPVGLPQLDMTAFSLAGLPNISSATLETANGKATANLGIKNLSNSTQDIVELSLNAFSSYSGGTSSGAQYSYVVPSVSIDNTFTADFNVLTITYDFSSIIKLTTPTAGQLSYQGLFMGFSVTEDTVGAVSQKLLFVDNNYEVAAASKTLSGFGTALFNVTPGKTYSISADISPDLFTSGSVTENSSNSVLKLGFSNRAVTAVPEPETYAMLLAGLALVGFSARRKTQA